MQSLVSTASETTNKNADLPILQMRIEYGAMEFQVLRIPVNRSIFMFQLVNCSTKLFVVENVLTLLTHPAAI